MSLVNGFGGFDWIAHLMIWMMRNKAARRIPILMASLRIGTVNSHIRSIVNIESCQQEINSDTLLKMKIRIIIIVYCL